ncbi:UbiX family flavin prenyltransferase [Actinokineospora spheciospongiae]|uniref:UbiX family flavin prenyltransferase n=1 Tax=Actinokineospora spheciospongiae TaxID=909613 RepID=UPI000D714811|nr:UbiX family flavin prenyltransferase [Actinokineospora spheciospongiae]PWW58260.1 4-hydroxy-3-polyprenylbenzoate decarboxylase [Actinokineospora spheciospongiae]
MSSLPLVVAITGASGVAYGIRALERLREMDVETHLVVTKHARATIAVETDRTAAEVKGLASVCHSEADVGAPIASGSFRTRGMLVLPCSIRTLSGVANSTDDNLVIRAADVQLKERRPVVLAVRETPLHGGHLRLMGEVTGMGGIIMPPVPAFYHRPTTVAEIVDHTVVRCLDLLGLSPEDAPRWNGRRGGEPRPLTLMVDDQAL